MRRQVGVRGQGTSAVRRISIAGRSSTPYRARDEIADRRGARSDRSCREFIACGRTRAARPVRCPAQARALGHIGGARRTQPATARPRARLLREWRRRRTNPRPYRHLYGHARISRRIGLSSSLIVLVGAGRFELPTPCAQGRCATRLRYAPTGEASLILNHFLFDQPSRNSFYSPKLYQNCI
jgi:hypothetical protein